MDFSELEDIGQPTYYCIVVKSTGELLHLPFKREFEKQTYEILPFNKKNLDSSSYWVEGVANKLLRKACRDSELDWCDFAIYEYNDNTFE